MKNKIKIHSAFFDFSFSVFGPEIRKLFDYDQKYDDINKEFVKEIKSAIRKYKNKAKKYLKKKEKNNANFLQSKRKAHLSKEKPMDMEN